MTPDEILRQADEQIASRKSANKPATASGAQSDDGWRDPWSEAPSTPSTKPLSDMEVGFDAPARGLKGWGQDIAATAVKSAIAVPEFAVGLADIPTGGRVGKFLENKDGAFGFRPKEAKEIVND